MTRRKTNQQSTQDLPESHGKNESHTSETRRLNTVIDQQKEDVLRLTSKLSGTERQRDSFMQALVIQQGTSEDLECQRTRLKDENDALEHILRSQQANQHPLHISVELKDPPKKGLDSSKTEGKMTPLQAYETTTVHLPRLVEPMNPDPSTAHSNDSDDEDKDDTLVIHTSLLIPGKGTPTKNSTIVIGSGKIIYVGSKADLPKKYQKAPSTYVPVLMPGLWDCHIHLMGTDSLAYTEFTLLSQATAGARLARSVHDILMSGFTSVRDLGGYAPEIAKVVEEGTIPGPNIYSAGSALSQTAGHGDTFELPIGFVWSRCGVGYGTGNGDDVACRPLCIADGVDECRRAVRLMIRRGAKVIKVLASGGVLSRDDDPKFQQFSDEELKVIVEEAARMHRIVAAHVHGKAGIMAALRAGCKTLEHGTYLDEEAVDLMLEKDVMLIATRLIVIEGVKHKDLLGPEQRRKMEETAKYHKRAYGLAIKKGVKCALGTDLGVSAPGQPLSHGSAGAELLYAVEAGMTPLQAIEAATANGPATLGPMAPLSGQIKEGYDADLIGLEKNPIDDIGLFKNVKNVTHVWKGGKLFKDTSVQDRHGKDVHHICSPVST